MENNWNGKHTVVAVVVMGFLFSVAVYMLWEDVQSTKSKEPLPIPEYVIHEEDTLGLGRSGISRYVVSRVAADEEEEEYDFYVMGVANIPLKDTVKIERMRSYDPVKGLVLLDSYVIIPEGKTQKPTSPYRISDMGFFL